MENMQLLHPIQDYPIDNIPLNINDYIKVYKSAISFVLDFGIESFLSFGKRLYYLNVECYREYEELKTNLDFMSLVVATGYDIYTIRDLFAIMPEAFKHELTANHPNIIITEIDKSLLGWIMGIYNNIFFLDDKKELFYSFLCFLYNTQSYEQRTKSTVDMTAPFDDMFVFSILFTSYPSNTSPKTINLSDSEVNDLVLVLSYREKVRNALLKARITEKEYACNEQNKCYWDKFIACINNHIAEEQRLTTLIYSDVEIDSITQEYETFLHNIFNREAILPEVGISIDELIEKIEERERYAKNYMWAKTDDGTIVEVDKLIIAVLALPTSFNCVLIAYHAFLLKQNEETFKYLSFVLSFYIIRNLSQLSEVSEFVESFELKEDLLLYISKLIFDFYETHSKTIESLRYNSILTEDALSGLDFNGEIINFLLKKAKKDYADSTAFDNIDCESKEVILSYLLDLEHSETPNGLNPEIRSKLHSIAQNNKTIFAESIENETSKRLIVTINAIYILVQAIDHAFPLGLIEENKREDLDNTRKRLSKLEDYLVKKTYIAPDFKCFENADLDMDGYRIQNGIDATTLEKINEKSYQRTLFNLAKNSIRDLHSEIDNLNFEKARQIKEELRTKMNNYPDCELKEQIYELVDQETYCLCDALTLISSNTSEFGDIKQSLKDYIGPVSDLLPDGTINALTTAELLLARYSSPEFSSVDFDYSCISCLYYQSFESLYNELLWTKYANKLNLIKEKGDRFPYLYKKRKLPNHLEGYLPSNKPDYFMSKDKTDIVSFLTMGSFEYLLYNVTSLSSNTLPEFRLFLDKVFGINAVSHNSEEYKKYQNRIDDLYYQIKTAIPKRNAASHGKNAINLKDCISDKKIVLSDLESVKNNCLGLIISFLSLYKK